MFSLNTGNTGILLIQVKISKGTGEIVAIMSRMFQYL